jgi:hypothetical protein
MNQESFRFDVTAGCKGLRADVAQAAMKGLGPGRGDGPRHVPSALCLELTSEWALSVWIGVVPVLDFNVSVTSTEG